MQTPKFNIGDIIMLKKQFVTEVSKVVGYSIDNEDGDVSYILETGSTYSGNRLELYQKSYQYCEANKDTFNKELAIKLLESIVSNSTPRLDNDGYNLMKDSYEQLLNMLQKSYQSSNSYIGKNVKAFKCHKNWRELGALDDYPLGVYLVEEIVSENKLGFYFRSGDIICQFYSDVEEIIQSEDKPIENEQVFGEAIMLLKDVRQYATDMTSHADSYEAQSAYKKYKKLLSILENKIFTI